MKTITRLRALFALLFLLGCGTLLLTLSSCGGGSSGSGTESRTAALGTSVKNVLLTANQPTEIRFAYTIPGAITSKGDFSVNIAETLKNISLSSIPIANNEPNILDTFKLFAAALIKDAFAQDQAQVTVFVSYEGDPNVCSSPNMFGPYTILGAIGSTLTGDRASDTPTDTVIDISNMGSVEVCVVTTPPIDAYLTVTGVVVDFEDCAEPSVNIANSDWVGTYSCENFGVGNEEGDVAITITRNQDGSYHYSDEAGAEYDGHLCGNKFKFRGGLASSDTESGTLVFASNTKLQKTSTWNSIPPGFSGGRCADSMDRL